MYSREVLNDELQNSDSSYWSVDSTMCVPPRLQLSCSVLPKIDDSGRSILFQVLQQQVSHVKWSKVVNPHGDLEVLLGPVVRRYKHACVIDQDVQRRPTVQKLIGKVLDRPAVLGQKSC